MTAPILICLLMLAAVPSDAKPKPKKSGFDKFIHSLFAPRRPVICPRQHRIIRRSSPTGKSGKTICVVDREWLNHYWELEALWDYYIPEDDQIQFKRGRYTVPIVVFRHYEDMKNSER